MQKNVLTLFGCGEDCSREFGVRLGGLGGHDDLGSILSGLESDGLADSAAGASNVEGFAG